MEKYRNKTIVFFGDSITDTDKRLNEKYPYGVGYVNMIKTELDLYYSDLNITIYNEGISADETGHLLNRFEKDLKSKNPDLVFMLIGINDVWHPYEAGTTPNNQEILNKITLLREKISDLGSDLVLILPYLFPIEPYFDFFNNMMPHYLSFYKDYKEYIKNNNLKYIDIYEIMKPLSDITKDNLTKDSVHPNVLGHAVIAQAILDYLNNN